MGFTRDLIDGLVQLIAATGVTAPGYAYGIPDGQGVPDIAYAVADYTDSGDPTQPTDTIRLQFRTRSAPNDPRGGMDLSDAIKDALDGTWPVTLSTGVVLSSLVRVSGAPFGRDATGRWERVTNYEARAYRPSPNRG